MCSMVDAHGERQEQWMALTPNSHSLSFSLLPWQNRKKLSACVGFLESLAQRFMSGAGGPCANPNLLLRPHTHTHTHKPLILSTF